MNLTRSEATVRSTLLTVPPTTSPRCDQGDRVFRSTTVVTFDAAQGASTFIDAVTDTVHRVTSTEWTSTPRGRRRAPHRTAEPAASNRLVVEADMPYMNTGRVFTASWIPLTARSTLHQCEVPDSRRVFAVFEQPDPQGHVSASP
jgi:aminopeptidase N